MTHHQYQISVDLGPDISVPFCLCDGTQTANAATPPGSKPLAHTFTNCCDPSGVEFTLEPARGLHRHLESTHAKVRSASIRSDISHHPLKDRCTHDPGGVTAISHGSKTRGSIAPHSIYDPGGVAAAFRVRDRSEKPGVASSPRGLAADSPTVLHLSTGTHNTSTGSV